MLIEVLTTLTVRLNQREQVLTLTPGQPVELPDEKALKLLQKAPGQVRIVRSADPAPSNPNASAPYIGQVVQVESATGQRVLTLVAAILQDDPRLPAGRWLGLAVGENSRWVRASSIKDWQPRCGACGGSRWWWTPEPVVQCAMCQPPNPDWQRGFEELADWTHGILPDNPRLPAILAAVNGCDAAWLAKDWGRFQRHMFEVQWLVLRGGQIAEGGTDEK